MPNPNDRVQVGEHVVRDLVGAIKQAVCTGTKRRELYHICGRYHGFAYPSALGLLVGPPPAPTLQVSTQTYPSSRQTAIGRLGALKGR